MKVILRERSVELIADTEHDKDALERLHKAGAVTVRDGATRSKGYPPSDRDTNVLLILPDPDKW